MGAHEKTKAKLPAQTNNINYKELLAAIASDDADEERAILGQLYTENLNFRAKTPPPGLKSTIKSMMLMMAASMDASNVPVAWQLTVAASRALQKREDVLPKDIKVMSTSTEIQPGTETSRHYSLIPAALPMQVLALAARRYGVGPETFDVLFGKACHG